MKSPTLLQPLLSRLFGRSLDWLQVEVTSCCNAHCAYCPRTVYKSDAYERFIKRLKVDWSSVAILQILKAKEMSITDLASLKGNIEAETTKLADQLKSKYSLDKNVEVVFSISNFFLLEPKEK